MLSQPVKPLTPLISLTDVSIGWDHRKVLSDISFTVDTGDFIAITGPNGGGKTTLLRILLGLLKPDKGSVIHHVENLRIGYLPQKNKIDSNFPVSVRDVITSGLLSLKLSRDEQQARYQRVIEQMGLVEHADRPIGLLSGGQLQRALLGRAIISKPALLVLDEPLSYIDKHFEHHLYQLMEDLKKTTTIVLVSHEMTQIATMANRHFIVDQTLTICHASHHSAPLDCR